MDYARKIGKTEGPKKWDTHPTPATTVHDNSITEDEATSEDRRLANWKRWLANRKKQYRHTKSTTGRDQNDQVLNSCEKVRSLIETRNLIDSAAASAPLFSDKYRGSPEFWRTPPMLSNRGDPRLPDVFATLKKKGLDTAPELTYVDLPELTEREKDLVGLKARKPRWKNSQYLKTRRKDLADEIELILPAEPRTKDLSIQGHAPQVKRKEVRIPPITIDTPQEEDEDNEDLDQIIILKIQDREIKFEKSTFTNEEANVPPLTWSVIFEGETDRRVEKKIVFKNKGNSIITYEWRHATFNCEFMHFGRRASPFFFNKTKGLVLPGQIVELTIWYLPRNGGIFSETWKFVTDPKLCTSPLLFRFWGCAMPNNEKNLEELEVRSIDAYLDQCIRDSAIRRIINEIMEDVDHVKPPEPAYSSLFLESDIFTAKNPLCFYYPSLVIEWRTIYHAITDEKSCSWSLSLDDLRDALLEIKDPERRNKMLSEFSQMYKKCLKPSLRGSVNDVKHGIVYNVLCSLANRFDIENEYVRSACSMKECSSSISEADEFRSLTPQGSVKSSSSRDRQTGRSGTLVEDRQSVNRGSVSEKDCQAYREIFFIRIHEVLGDTIERISAIVESFNRLNRMDR